MRALFSADKIGLVLTTVLDQMVLGLVDDDEEGQEPTDRAYWETRSSKKELNMVDKLLDIAKKHDPDLDLEYNKFYIGLAKDGTPINFIVFKPKKSFLRIEPKLKNKPETQERLETAGLDVMDYDGRWGRYRIRLQLSDLEKHENILIELIAQAYNASAQD